MAQVIFYEKPGCINNTKQKKLLVGAGHEVISKNILETHWDKDRLVRYFEDKPVAQWFNTTAPRIKSKEINPESFNREQALALMVEEPILIKRPLIRVGNRRIQGFDKVVIDKWIGLKSIEGSESIVSELMADDLTRCPQLDKNTNCDDQKSQIPVKPLSLLMDITSAAGLEVTYEYDDLVFVSHNIFIYRFTEIGEQVDIIFNQECEIKAEKQLMATLLNAAQKNGIILSRKGYYNLSKADDQNINIEFFENPLSRK